MRWTQCCDTTFSAFGFRRSVDKESGGFYSNFARDWQPARSDGKFSVFQGRMTWVAARIVIARPDLKDRFLPIIDHGMKYLSEVLWDKQHGGFFWGLDDTGKIAPQFTDGKDLYGMSFGLYGAAAAYQATKDPKALELAQKAFRWMDEHAHDAKNGGYFEWLTRDGKVVRAKAESARIDAGLLQVLHDRIPNWRVTIAGQPAVLKRDWHLDESDIEGAPLPHAFGRDRLSRASTDRESLLHDRLARDSRSRFIWPRCRNSLSDVGSRRGLGPETQSQN